MSAGRPESLRSRMIRVGFLDSARGAQAFERLGGWCEPLLALLARTADPDLAVDTLADLAERIGRDQGEDARTRLPRGAHRRRGLLDAPAVGARREPGARGAPDAPPRAVARADRPDPRAAPARPAYVMRASLLEAVGADPADAAPVATLDRRSGRRRAAGGVPPDPAPARRPRPGPRGRRRRRRRRALRPGRRHPRRRAGRGPGPGRRGRPRSAASRSSRWASAAATSSTTSATSTSSSSPSPARAATPTRSRTRCAPPPSWPRS